MTSPTEQVLDLEIDILSKMIDQFERLRSADNGKFDKKVCERIMRYINSYAADTLKKDSMDE